jgi:hypothetical protein
LPDEASVTTLRPAAQLTLLDIAQCSVYLPSLAMLAYLYLNAGIGEAVPINPDEIGPKLNLSPKTARKARDFLLHKGKIGVSGQAEVTPKPGRKATLYTIRQGSPAT